MKLSLKHARRAQHLRGLNAAAKKSKLKTLPINRLYLESHNLLDGINLNSPPSRESANEVPNSLKKLGITADMPFSEVKKILEVEPCETEEDHPHVISFLQLLAQGQEQKRQTNWAWRIAQEEKEMYAQGWYPFFITLTLDPALVDRDAFWRNTNHFKNYVRSIARKVARVCGHPPPHKTTKAMPFTRPDSDYVRYVASLEHGKSREHHHIHMLLWCRDIPAWWKADPNLHRPPHMRNYTQCWALKAKWKYGNCTPEYFRCKNDIWSQKHGFCTPTTIKTLKPIGKAGFYLTKYMQKERKEWKHRMRATRALGLTRLRSLLHMLPPATVEALTWRPHNKEQHHSVNLIHSVPLALTRCEAKRMNYYNQFRFGLLDTKRELQQKCKPFLQMLKSVKDGARPDRMPLTDFYDWLSQHLPDEKGYCSERLVEAHETFIHHFPRIVGRSVNQVLPGI